MVPGDEVDSDGDGFLACAECDDSDDTVFPGAPELCDGIDNDCDGAVPDDEQDDDGDGFAPCDGDCDDSDPAVAPDGVEVCEDGKDNDCDGVTDPEDRCGTVAEGCDCEASIGASPRGAWTLILLVVVTLGRSRRR